MLIVRLRTKRRFKYRNIIDVFYTYNRLRKEGKIKYVPPRWSNDLIPFSILEVLSFCWICLKIVISADHYTTCHEDLNSKDNISLLTIGHIIINRIQCPGAKEAYLTGNCRNTLIQNIQMAYGPEKSAELKRPCKRVRQRNNRVNRANKFLKETLLKKHPVGRKLLISMEHLSICRADLDGFRRLFCISCGVWLTGNWSYHKESRHKEFTDLENETIRLYSCWIKMNIATRVLITRKSTIPEDMTALFEYLKAACYTLDDETFDTAWTSGFPKREKIKWLFGIMPKKIAMPGHTIRWRKHTSFYKQPINAILLYVAYKKFEELYNKGQFKGFSNMLHTIYMKSIEELSNAVREEFSNENPADCDCLNFMYIRTGQMKKRRGHVVLTEFKAKEKTLTVYDGMLLARQRPLGPFIRSMIELHHGHVEGPLKIGYSKLYSVQSDKYSCGYRSLFAALALMNNVSPEDYDMVEDQLFAMVKFAIEGNGRRLRWWTIAQVWHLIAKKKQIRIKERNSNRIVFQELTNDSP